MLDISNDNNIQTNIIKAPLASGLMGDNYTYDSSKDLIVAKDSYTLPDNIKNMILSGGASQKLILPTAIEANVYGNPLQWKDYLDYYQGDNSRGYESDCAVVSCENLLIQAGKLSFRTGYVRTPYVVDEIESIVVDYAATTYSYSYYRGYEYLIVINYYDPYGSGGMYVDNEPKVLSHFGVDSYANWWNSNSDWGATSLETVGNRIKNNQCIIALVDANVLWGEIPNYVQSNHAVLITGVAYNVNNPSKIEGFYICDSGSGRIDGRASAARFISYDLAFNCIRGITYTSDSVKLLIDNINGNGNALDNSITGNAGNNILNGLSGNDTLNGGGGVDRLVGGVGDDTYVVNSFSDVITESAGQGTDTVQTCLNNYILGSNLENLVLTGSSSLRGIGNELNNNILGTISNDTINGQVGNDTIDGGLGSDSLIGGSGDDTYVVDSFFDAITEWTWEGIDTVQTCLDDYNLAANVENLVLTGITGIKTTGNDLNNNIIGTISNDNIDGGAGDDTLDGGSGNDSLIGGLGDDTYVVDSFLDVITELAGQGRDTVHTYLNNYYLEENLEDLLLKSDSALKATGNILNNNIIGTISNDTIDGGVGNDTMIGGLGDDNYIVDSLSDVVTENKDAGIDTIHTCLNNYNLGANVENLVLTGISALKAIGNILNNNIIGTISNDNIEGGAGNDTIDGGLGNDSLIGGLGDETYVLDSFSDVITEFAKQGTDTVKIFLNDYILGANVENLVLTGDTGLKTTGNSLNNRIAGTIGNDTLIGGLGVDTLIGGLGDDTYIVDNFNDLIIESSNLSSEINIVNSSASYRLGNNLETLILTGNLNIKALGNSLNNTLIGNDGINIVFGGFGADRMTGGLGNDNYFVDNTGDEVIESSNALAEIDTVNSAITYNLGDNLENLVLTGSDNINGLGNVLNNNIVGNIGNNILDGGIGNDTIFGKSGNDNIFGGAGNDYLDGGAGDDTYIFTVGDGKDTIKDRIGNDKIKFDNLINQSRIAFFKDNLNNLIIDYGINTGTEKITINSWTNTKNQIEKIQLDNGQYFSNSNINKLIQDMAAYSTQMGIQITSVDMVKNNQDLMNLVVAGWQS